MEKELKIEVPIGYEIDRQKSTFEKIVFKKIDSFPKTWEEYCEHERCGSNQFYSVVSSSSFRGVYDEFSNKERVGQFVALGKLLQLRDCWVKGYDEFRYALFGTKVGISIFESSGFSSYSLTFPTREMAKEFKNCFSDLIKQAFPLV